MTFFEAVVLIKSYLTPMTLVYLENVFTCAPFMEIVSYFPIRTYNLRTSVSIQ